jgi:mevalonate kinase
LKFYSNGKLLITGEYLVLDGAKSLALPTKFGQDLSIKSFQNTKATLHWKSYNLKGDIWFECNYKLPSLQVVNTSDSQIANTLQKILLISRDDNPNFLKTLEEILVTTTLNFKRNWGLGTSSTLINNIASWAKVDAFNLQFKVFGGSAYDIACAQNRTPILYQLKNNTPTIKKVDFNPLFKENLYFIYLNQKQNSRDAINFYRNNKIDKTSVVSEITAISNKILQANLLEDFENLIKNHENIISSVIGIEPIQERLFSDYFGQIKSLGAWGGDFILATGNKKTIPYFNNKGFHTVIPYKDIIL